MEDVSSENRHTEVPVKKRGPYKRYACCGSISRIPKATQHDWKKQKTERETPIMDSGCHKGISSAHLDENLEIVLDEDPQPYSYHIMDETTLDENELLGSQNMDADQQHHLESNVDSVDNIPESAHPEENYSNEFLIQILMIFAIKLRHNLTYKAAEDVGQMLRIMNSTSSPKITKYHWQKMIHNFSPCMTVHYICDVCHLYVGVQSNCVLQCENCSKVIDLDKNSKSNNVFIHLSLTYQLRQIFELTTAHSACQKRREKQRECAFEDIFDGELYKRTFVDGMLSINFSVDGVPVFDSSNSSIYPTLCTINDLHPRERKNHVLLASLWFGSGKPKMNEYLKPFVNEIRSLYTDGFTYKYEGIIYKKKCNVLAGICDSVARPMLRNSTQFNGMYGCGLCLHSGEVIEKGRGITRVYPLGVDGSPFGQGLRTHNQTLIHCQNREMGIKGLSVLNNIPNFDIISCLDVDWMHAVALGVCRQFAGLWFNSANHKEEFYLGHCIGDIDKLILSYHPTAEVSRTPREISERAHWKAHEWVVFLLFYSLPILHKFFPMKYVQHWSLLVDAIQILLKTSIMRSEIVFAERSLIQFIRGVEELYGRQHVGFNVHLLAHLGQSVVNLGPLWTHSAFIYENENQVLLSYVKSSNGVAMQICDAVRTKCVVERLKYECKDDLTTEQTNYLRDLFNKSVRPKPSVIAEGVCMIGKATIHQELTRPHHLAFERANVQIGRLSVVESYKQILRNGEIVQSKAYTKVKKRRNYCVSLVDGEIFEIELFYVVTEDHSVSYYVLGKYFKKHNQRLIKDRRLEHLSLLKKSPADDLSIVNVSAIKEKVIMLEMEHLQILVACSHPNHFEVLV